MNKTDQELPPVWERQILLLASRGVLRQNNLPRAVSRRDIQYMHNQGLIYSQPIPRHWDGSIVQYEITPNGVRRLGELESES